MIKHTGMVLMSQKEWISATYDRIRPRSSLLKKIDQALLNYERMPSDGNLMALGYSLADWKKSKPDWLDSVRNRNGAVYRLAVQVTENPAFITQEKMLTEAERTNLRMLFAGKQLQTSASRLSTLKSAAFSALKADFNVGQIAGGVANTSKAAPASFPMAQKLIGACFGDDGAGGSAATQVVTDLLGSDFITGFVKKAVPFVGLIKSGVDVATFWGTAAKRRYDRYQAEKATSAVRPGDASAALEAIKRILTREQNQNMRRGVMQTAEFTARVTAPPGVGSIASGLNGLGQLGETIFQIGRDYREKRAANPILRGNGKLDASVFNVSPVLGCYLTACSTRSNVLNVLFEDIGTEGWMTNAERLNHEIAPVIEQARRIISDSRFVIPDMPLIAMTRQPGTEDQQQRFAAKREYYTAGRLMRFFMAKPPGAR